MNWRGVQLLRTLIIELFVMVAIGVALAALGPYGSFAQGGFATRLAYWVPGALLGYAVFRPSVIAAVRLSRRFDLPQQPATLIGVLAGAVPASFLILWWNGNGFGATPTFDRWFELYVQVAIIGALVAAVFILLDRWNSSPASRAATPEIAKEADSATPPPFFHRLPHGSGQLIALEMEDHYLRAHTETGSTLLLMRMRDAETELQGADGLRVHRSWWVSRAALEQSVRDGRNWKLKLRGGIEAPVARDRITALRDAGWLAP